MAAINEDREALQEALDKLDWTPDQIELLQEAAVEGPLDAYCIDQQVSGFLNVSLTNTDSTTPPHQSPQGGFDGMLDASVPDFSECAYTEPDVCEGRDGAPSTITVPSFLLLGLLCYLGAYLSM